MSRSLQIFSRLIPDRGAAGRYAPFSIANLMSIQQREQVLAQMLAKRGLVDLRGLEILDVRCGWGNLFLQLMLWGASPGTLHGIEVQAERVRVARAKHPELDVRKGSAASLPWDDARFDIVYRVHDVYVDPK